MLANKTLPFQTMFVPKTYITRVLAVSGDTELTFSDIKELAFWNQE